MLKSIEKLLVKENYVEAFRSILREYNLMSSKDPEKVFDSVSEFVSNSYITAKDSFPESRDTSKDKFYVMGGIALGGGLGNLLENKVDVESSNDWGLLAIYVGALLGMSLGILPAYFQSSKRIKNYFLASEKEQNIGNFKKYLENERETLIGIISADQENCG